MHGYGREEPEDGTEEDGVPDAFLHSDQREALGYIRAHASGREDELLGVTGSSGARAHEGVGAPWRQTDQNKSAAYANVGHDLLHRSEQRAQTGMTAGMQICEADGSLQVLSIAPGGPAALTRQICKGDVVVSVDPGKEFLKVHWYWQQQVGEQRRPACVCCGVPCPRGIKMCNYMVVQGDRSCSDWVQFRDDSTESSALDPSLDPLTWHHRQPSAPSALDGAAGAGGARRAA